MLRHELVVVLSVEVSYEMGQTRTNSLGRSQRWPPALILLQHSFGGSLAALRTMEGTGDFRLVVLRQRQILLIWRDVVYRYRRSLLDCAASVITSFLIPGEVALMDSAGEGAYAR